MNALMQSSRRQEDFPADPRASAISESSPQTAIRTILLSIGKYPDKDGLRRHRDAPGIPVSRPRRSAGLIWQRVDTETEQ